jgi:hypothetical protein
MVLIRIQEFQGSNLVPDNSDITSDRTVPKLGSELTHMPN